MGKLIDDVTVFEQAERLTVIGISVRSKSEKIYSNGVDTFSKHVLCQLAYVIDIDVYLLEKHIFLNKESHYR